MAEGDFIIRLVQDGDPNSPGHGSSGGLGSFGVKLGAAIAIGQELVGIVKDAVMTVLAPVIGIIKGVARMLAEFLRPIADIVYSLIRPVFIILQPMLALFKTFMAPFITIAKQFSDLAARLAAPGPNQNIAGSMEAAIGGVNALLGPFIISLASVALQLATSVIIGAVASLLDLIPIFGGHIAEKSQGVINSINGKISDGTTALLDVLQSQSETKLAELSERFPGILNEPFIAIPEGIVSETTKIVQQGSDEQKALVTEGTNAITDTIALTLGPKGTITTDFQNALDRMVTSAWNFHGQLVTVADSIDSIRIKGPKSTSKGKKALGLLGTLLGLDE